MMVTALITGVNGFCGRYLVKRLLDERSNHVVGLDIHSDSFIRHSSYNYVQVDISNYEKLSSAIFQIQPDLVFHLAGLVRGAPADIYRVNFQGAVNLLESVHTIKSDARVLIVGSAAEYGYIDKSDLPVTEEYPCRPFGPYGLSKYCATMVGLDYARRLGMKVVIARPFNIIGAGIPESFVVGALLTRIKKALQTQEKPVVKVGNLDSERDFVSADDVVEAYLRMINGNFWGETFNICSGQAYSIRKVAGMLLSHSARPIRLEFDPALGRSSEVDIAYGSNEKARRCFDFNPNTNIEEMLRIAWEYEMGREVQ